jgi:erythromycin esterase
MTHTDPALADWFQDNAHRIRTLDPTDEDFSDLAPLREIVGDARVVCIGESTHRVHEFYQVRHRLARFLIAELGFSAFVMESGFPEGLAVNDWVLGGPGDLDRLLRHGITYHMGNCHEMRDQLEWLREYNATQNRKVRFYGMDVSDSAASAKPSVDVCLSFLDGVDPAYAAAVRSNLLPLFDYLPTDRSGLAWAAPAIQAYLALDPAHRYELTARIGELAERLRAMRVVYGKRDRDAAEVAVRCAATGRHTDAFLAAMAAGPERTYSGANIRDAAMAENIEWILRREERIVVGAANGHIQRWPFQVPPFVPDPLSTAGEHLAATLGDELVVIGTTSRGGEVWLHRAVPDAAPGHTETFVEEIGPFAEPDCLDVLMSETEMPLCLVDLRAVPARGPVAERFAATTSIMTGPHPQPVSPVAAFDAVVHVDRLTPWHTLIA